MSTTPRKVGGVYVDGFNLYHALDDLGKPYLKWLNLRRLADIFARGHAHTIGPISFCTAFFPGDFDKKKRHETYNAALRSESIAIKLGHTTKEPQGCNRCDHKWDHPREKETDINVALSAYHDALRGAIDVAFILSADTDQAATLNFLKDYAPHVSRVVVTPPGRAKSKHLRDLSDANIQLTEDMIDSCLFPAMITPETGRLIIRPLSYAPPEGWVHPDARSKS